ncbi:MAG: cytochrome c [Chitinophagaceae bacterium]|nr:cytochrome c [Chitinophagaceae bacterium]
MKKFLIIAGCVAMGFIISSCNKTRRSTGRAYMPDMAYSNAYETYAPAAERLKAAGAYYSGMPVAGTVARGDMFAYTLKNDTVGYAQSVTVKNPLSADSIDMKEAERLYLVNCGICHGTKLDGNGPLFKGGDGPYIAKPATLVGDPVYEAMPEGKMFHSVTYGKGAMGSYASQMSTKQRWMVVAYIKSKQSGGKTPAGIDSTTAAKPVDTTAVTR